MSASWESLPSSCCSGCWSAVASSLAPTLSGPAGQPSSILHLIPIFGSHENHMDRQACNGDTVLIKTREMTGRSQTLPWWLGE
jgi:hypothetical protein